MLGERDDEQSFAFEFLGGLAEAPGVVDEFADVELGGERPDVIDGLEDTAVAVVDADADVQVRVDVDDGGR